MGLWGLGFRVYLNPPDLRLCRVYSRNLIKKPWAYNPQDSRTHIRNPNKDPRFLNQVLTLGVGFGFVV